MEPNKKIVVKRAGRARARRADEARPRANDRVADAQQAAETYRITTPLVADEDRDMTGAYDVLGQGMHPNTAGHTFILVDRQGVIRWRRDYWLGSEPTMYVPPNKLFADIPNL